MTSEAEIPIEPSTSSTPFNFIDPSVTTNGVLISTEGFAASDLQPTFDQTNSIHNGTIELTFAPTTTTIAPSETTTPSETSTPSEETITASSSTTPITFSDFNMAVQMIPSPATTASSTINTSDFIPLTPLRVGKRRRRRKRSGGNQLVDTLRKKRSDGMDDGNSDTIDELTEELSRNGTVGGTTDDPSSITFGE